VIRIGRARGIKARQAGLRAARRDLARVRTKTIVGVIERRVVPTANGWSPSIVSGHMVGRATMSGGRLTTNATGRTRAIIGILNFGGTLSFPITPKRKKALSFNGVARARVTAPRTIAGKHWMERAVLTHRGSVRMAIAIEMPRAIQAHINAGG